MTPLTPIESREVNGLTVIGPELFARDPQGKLLGPIASIFPASRILVIGREIHSLQAERALDFLRERGDRTEGQEEQLYGDAVSLLIRESTVLIRSDPHNMSRMFAADVLLQRLLPKDRIQFTGIHLEKVRKRLRLRGESWRISPPPTSMEEIGQYVRASRVHVGTGATYYQNAHTGGRFLTYEEFAHIRPLLREDREEALARIEEVIHLIHCFNHQGVRELSPLLPAGRSLDVERLTELTAVLEHSDGPDHSWSAEGLFDEIARSFAEAAGHELASDREEHMIWRKTVFCRLSEIHEKTLEEWSLGLSPEFHLNVRWLQGASILAGQPLFEAQTETRVRSLINHFRETRSGLMSINVGRVEASQTERDRTGEEREVYLVVLGLPGGEEEIRLLRMMKWDVMHRLKRGTPKDQAIEETNRYRDYIFDRLRAFEEFRIPIPAFTEIRLEEEASGLGPVPVFFFDRPYVSGIATDKIPPGRYAQEGFMPRLAPFLGMAAAVSLALGRASPRTGRVFFDDGDEVVLLDKRELPVNLVITETTGSFTDWSTPMADLLPQCLSRLVAHLERARSKGISAEELSDSVQSFSRALVGEVERLRQLLEDRSGHLRALYNDRSPEPGGIRYRWQALLDRILETDTAQLRQIIAEDDRLAPFRDNPPYSRPGRDTQTP